MTEICEKKGIYPLETHKVKKTEPLEESFIFDENLDFDKNIEKLCSKHISKSPSKIAAWFNHCVIFGIYENGKITWAEDDKVISWKQFIEMRIFNDEEELYIGKNKIRRIKDSPADSNTPEEETTEYVETRSRLWGEKESVKQGFAVLHDKERQIKMTVPYVGENTEKDKGTYYELILRSYIGYNKTTGQAGYAYYRYADIVKAEKGE